MGHIIEGKVAEKLKTGIKKEGFRRSDTAESPCLLVFSLVSMVRRARVKTGTGKRRVYSGKYALPHMIYCSDCGDLYWRTQWFLKGEQVLVWRCVSRLEKKNSGIDRPYRTI